MHRLLERQVRKAFGPDGPPEEARTMLDLVDAAYHAADDDRQLLERAMEIAGEELLERNEELAARVEELEKAQHELAEADRWRKRFINAAAHELNTPLTPLKVQVFMLQHQKDRARFAEGLRVLERSVDRMILLVRDLLDAAKIQSDHLALRPQSMDLVAVANDCLQSMAGVAKSRHIQLDADIPEKVEVFADPLRVGQVIDNLLSNALKFTPPGGRVHLRMSDTDPVRIQVADTGMGIRPADLGMLFRPFSRVHDDVPADGTGLGLYVSHGIMEASGGTLEAASLGPGNGATFTAKLPRA